MAFLVVLGIWAVVFVVVGRIRARKLATSEVAADPARRDPRQRQRLRVLPEGHRPPPGLGPLSPSERFLTQEAARGMRELQMFLDERAA